MTLDHLAWIDMVLSLPEEVRRRKTEAQTAALAEIGVSAFPSPDGGVLSVDWQADEAHHYRAHELACRAVGISSLSLDEWRAANRIPRWMTS